MCEIIPVPTFHPMIFNSMFYFCGTRSSRYKCISPVLSLTHARTTFLCQYIVLISTVWNFLAPLYLSFFSLSFSLMSSHLHLCVDFRFQRLPAYVPDADVAVARASAAGQDAASPWTPPQRLRPLTDTTWWDKRGRHHDSIFLGIMARLRCQCPAPHPTLVTSAVRPHKQTGWKAAAGLRLWLAKLATLWNSSETGIISDHCVIIRHFLRGRGVREEGVGGWRREWCCCVR